MSDLLEASKIGAQNEFYDAYLYDANIDNGPRVDTVYQQLLASNTDGVVEFGCGTGTLLLSLARNGTPTLGVDRSEQMLTTFRRKILDLPANAPKPSLAQADLLTPIARTSMSVAILANELCNHLLTREDLLTGLRNAADCQTAFKTDPRSASNIDPSSLCSRTGGEARSGQLAQRVAA